MKKRLRKSDEELYNKSYVEKYRDKENEGRLERLMPLIHFNKNDIVLDLGCGNGFLYNLIKDKINKYVGIDTSVEFIKDAKRRYFTSNNVEFYAETSTEHKEKNVNKYDKVFMMDFTEHVEDEPLEVILKESIDMLKPGGRVFIHTPNLDYFLERLKDKDIILKQFDEHIAVRNDKGYINLINKLPVSEYKIYYLNHYNKLLKPIHLLSYIPFIGKLFKARLFIVITK